MLEAAELYAGSSSKMHSTTDGATRRLRSPFVASMATSLQNSEKARAFPQSDARHIRPSDVRNEQGLPSHGRGRLKKLVQKEIRLRFATLNIGTLTGRHRELAEMLKQRSVNIACIQETKWRGSKAKEIGEGYKLIYHGTTSVQNGVAIVVDQHYRDNVTCVKRVSDRLISITIDSPSITAHIISCYAPQTGCTENEKDEFWNTLDTHLRSIPPDESIFLGGDLNGHVGSHRDGYVQCHGGQGLGVRNDDGCRILDCAEAHNMVVTNTYFKKRPTHLATYTSGGHATQIDYWMIRQVDLKMVMDTKVIPYNCVAPQHRLLVLDFRKRIRHSKKPKTGPARIRWWRMPAQRARMLTALENFSVNPNQSVEDLWNDAAHQIHQAATETLGKTTPGQKYIDKQTWWWDDEVQQVIKEKKTAYKTWWNSRSETDLQRYREKNLEAKREVAAAKARCYQDLYDQLDTPSGENNIYRIAQSRNRSTQDIGHVMYIKDHDNKILRDQPAILQRWSDYFADICNKEFPHPPIASPNPTFGPVPQITPKEVQTAIQKMKNGKVTGPDDIPAEIWKMLGKPAAEFLATLFEQIITENKLPHAWTTSITIPIWKRKGDVNDCSTYRPIRLLCHTLKIFERVLDRRLRIIATVTLNQCGFVQGCSTIDAIYATRLLMEKHRERQKSLHLAFLDLEKAFDRVPHDLIWCALRSHGIPEAYVKWVQLLYRNITSAVRSPAGISPPFGITVGVHQGSALSPLLFILCIDTATAEIQTPHPWTLLFADDVVLAQETRLELQYQTQTWMERLADYGLQLNIQKTEYLEFGPQTDGTIQIGNQDLPKTSSFKYLGSIVTSDGDVTLDTRARVNAAWFKWKQVTGVLCDKKMPRYLKSKVYKTVVRPVAIYGAETRPMTRKQEQSLHVMEMKMLRWTLGLTRCDHVRNTDVRHQLAVTPITEKVREARLRWYGHVMRRPENSVAKTALLLDPGGVRSRGRPVKRWMDNIKTDMHDVGLLPTDVNDRRKWKRCSKAADPV